jgi:hypothetical protein
MSWIQREGKPVQLSQAQFHQLGQVSFEMFIQRMVNEARRDWPEEFNIMGEERATRAIRMSVDLAQRHGFETEFDIARLVLLVFAYRSMQFLNEPWAVEHLQGEGPARERMNRLFDTALAALPD